MRVFITGASGWIGSATIDELLTAGHEVVGLARSDASAASLERKGARVLRGDLDDLESIRRGASEADAVIHLANKHDFDDSATTNRAERAAVETIGEALEGSGRRFLLAAGVAGLSAPGRLAVETDASPAVGPDSPRGGSENRALEFVDRDVHVVSLRFAPTVHGTGDHGFVSALTEIARATGRSAYVDEGANRWSAVHVSDAARLVRLGLEAAPAGSRLHAVGEEGIPTRVIAEAIGSSLSVPSVSVPRAGAMEHFGWIGLFFGMDVAASSAATRELLGWQPTGPTLAEDLASGSYADR